MLVVHCVLEIIMVIVASLCLMLRCSSRASGRVHASTSNPLSPSMAFPFFQIPLQVMRGLYMQSQFSDSVASQGRLVSKASCC